jgi:hypothetical protein
MFFKSGPKLQTGIRGMKMNIKDCKNCMIIVGYDTDDIRGPRDKSDCFEHTYGDSGCFYMEVEF